jgi:hypothetical protein
MLQGVSVESAIKKAIDLWKHEGLLIVIAEVTRNLSGKVLKRRTARLVGSVPANSRVTDKGFTVGTNVPYGIAWEKGIKARTIVPRPERLAANKRAALMFKVGGKVIYRKSAKIPAQAPRPWLEPAAQTTLPQLKTALVRNIDTELKACFPSQTFKIEITLR